MADDLLGALRAQCRRRPLDQPQRERIRLHMQACGIAAISDGALVFERDGSILKVLRKPLSASGEFTLV